MKKVILIGGGVALLGGLAYLYFKNKNKTNALVNTNGLLGSNTTQTAPIPTSGVVTNSTIDNSIQEQQNLDKAKEIMKQIKRYEILDNTRSYSPTSKKIFKRKIDELKNNLLKLGYEYKDTTDGVLVKL